MRPSREKELPEEVSERTIISKKSGGAALSQITMVTVVCQRTEEWRGGEGAMVAPFSN
ncbi:hypothetical protein SBA1_190084 [Candidatus Sulfotelmatobacter kueseliae]|uniref:Uncharacterized protein n=1 Tax=Candidatus Sulfotelmatobacter kueseliae TaxID=2042962 RepID=A0A2U3KEA3_9BACT|nr:hypothetical protein SBA1_190084 [Candidatus Sulfotelmatobacter kueseliae]